MPDGISDLTERLLFFGSGASKELGSSFYKEYMRKREAGTATSKDYAKANRIADKMKERMLASLKAADTDHKNGTSPAEFRTWLTRPEDAFLKDEVSFSRLKPREKLTEEELAFIPSQEDFTAAVALLDDYISKKKNECEKSDTEETSKNECKTALISVDKDIIEAGQLNITYKMI